MGASGKALQPACVQLSLKGSSLCFTLSVNRDNVKDQQFSCVLKCPGQREDFLSPIESGGGGGGQQLSSFDWHFKNPNRHSCFVEAKLHCLCFPLSR